MEVVVSSHHHRSRAMELQHMDSNSKDMEHRHHRNSVAMEHHHLQLSSKDMALLLLIKVDMARLLQDISKGISNHLKEDTVAVLEGAMVPVEAMAAEEEEDMDKDDLKLSISRVDLLVEQILNFGLGSLQ